MEKPVVSTCVWTTWQALETSFQNMKKILVTPNLLIVVMAHTSFRCLWPSIWCLVNINGRKKGKPPGIYCRINLKHRKSYFRESVILLKHQWRYCWFTWGQFEASWEFNNVLIDSDWMGFLVVTVGHSLNSPGSSCDGVCMQTGMRWCPPLWHLEELITWLPVCPQGLQEYTQCCSISVIFRLHPSVNGLCLCGDLVMALILILKQASAPQASVIPSGILEESSLTSWISENFMTNRLTAALQAKEQWNSSVIFSCALDSAPEKKSDLPFVL